MFNKLILGFPLIGLLSGCGMLSKPLPLQPTAIPTPASVMSSIPDASITNAPALGGKQIGDLSVWIFSNPIQPIQGDNTFEALVTDPQGKPVSDAALSFDINMTNMNHGKNVVTASPLGNGHYRGVVHFLMAGPWRVIVGIQRSGQTSTVRFDFMVN